MTYNNDWTNIKMAQWKDAEYDKWKMKEMDYIKMFPNPSSFDHNFDNMDEIINNILKKENRQTTKGTENHFGVFEDVKQPLIFDPVLDF